jgi:hypothetical protein
MISNVCYMAFNFLNLQSGWIHRMDRSNWERPFRCPTWLLGLGAVLGFVNMAFMGAGADVYGAGTLRNGLIGVLLILPVFAFRHYVQDKGVFPAALSEDFAESPAVKRAGALPWVALVACAVVVWSAHSLAKLPVPVG